MSPNHIVIVGAGHAGGCGAGALRAAGFRGRITIIGIEPHPPYERPPLSKELLAGMISLEKTYLHPPGWYGEADINLRLNIEVAHIDRGLQRLELSTGEVVPYDTLLLTTGARARVLPDVRRNSRIFYIRNIEDTLALRPWLKPGVNLGVIGAGFIGLEIAATGRKCGCAVTVLELAARPLARVAPPPIGEYVAKLHHHHGVDLQFGRSIVAIDTSEKGCAIHTSDGSTLRFDILAVGVGAVPNVELGKAAGLAVDDGIVVDQFGRTSDPAIFAAGDVTKHFNPFLKRAIRLEAWQNAQNQAIAVAKVMAGGTEPFSEVPWLWTDQYDMNLQIAGAPTAWDTVLWRDEPGKLKIMMFQLLQCRLVGVFAVNSGRDMRFARMLISQQKLVDETLLADTSVKLQDLCR